MLKILTTALFGLVILFVSREIFRILQGIRVCRKYSIPYIVVPFEPNSLAGTTLGTPLHRMLRSLPTFLQPACTNYLQWGWYYDYECEAWTKLGPSWALVTPGKLRMHVCDSVAGPEILERRDRGGNGNGFVRPHENYGILAVFGPNLSTATNRDWPRHRKVVAAPFSETVMADCWRESLRQATGLVNAWKSAGRVDTVATDLRTLSLNVLAGAGFKKGVEFESAATRFGKNSSEGPMSYRDALQTVLSNVILILVIPHNWLRRMFWSPRMLQVGKAAKVFEEHMTKMLHEEEEQIKQGSKGDGGIMSVLVRALNHDPHKDQKGGPPKGLSRQEVYGNIFVINFAGHDTTANTLAFATLLLTAHPEIQDWVAEELQNWLPSDDSSDWEYTALFLRLKRCRAVLLETLRVFPPVGLVPKQTTSAAQVLTLDSTRGGRQITIPAHTSVSVGVLAIQTSELWGKDAKLWKPRRWLSTGNADAKGTEQFIEPIPGSFLAWSGGPQNCPGAKFSEVEFVAVIARLLQNHRLEAIPLANETTENTRQRVMTTIHDLDLQLIAKIKHGDAVSVRLTKR